MIDRRINIPRYQGISVVEELSGISETELPRKFELGKAGQLQSLQWVQTAPITLAKDETEVETRAVGLNLRYATRLHRDSQLTTFKDVVLVGMGIVEVAKEGISLEGAGIVRDMGSEVEGFEIGDRVMIFEHGCFSTRIVISARLCAKIPSELSFEETATIPCVYAMIIHSLLTVGRLEAGQVGLGSLYPDITQS